MEVEFINFEENTSTAVLLKLQNQIHVMDLSKKKREKGIFICN